MQFSGGLWPNVGCVTLIRGFPMRRLQWESWLRRTVGQNWRRSMMMVQKEVMSTDGEELALWNTIVDVQKAGGLMLQILVGWKRSRRKTMCLSLDLFAIIGSTTRCSVKSFVTKCVTVWNSDQLHKKINSHPNMQARQMLTCMRSNVFKTLMSCFFLSLQLC